ncbi:MAG: nitroreductase family protein [Bacteroidota bacterium]
MSDFIPYSRPFVSAEDMIQQTAEHFAWMDQRRTLREFSDKPVPREVIENIIKTASTAPSGAHKQPWTFCAVGNADLKKQIREAAEKEEYTNYHGRMSDSWLDDLKAFGTDWHKPFLEIAPWLIIVFKKAYDFGEEGEKQNNYYVNESVGLATGFLLSAIHQAGLVALTHTPSPMNFLTKLLERPSNERSFLLIPVGYPAENAQVPVLERKGIEDISVFFE